MEKGIRKTIPFTTPLTPVLLEAEAGGSLGTGDNPDHIVRSRLAPTNKQKQSPPWDKLHKRYENSERKLERFGAGKMVQWLEHLLPVTPDVGGLNSSDLPRLLHTKWLRVPTACNSRYRRTQFLQPS